METAAVKLYSKCVGILTMFLLVYLGGLIAIYVGYKTR
jgi:hypothetical protein